VKTRQDHWILITVLANNAEHAERLAQVAALVNGDSSHVVMRTYEPHEGTGQFSPPYVLTCPICDSRMEAIVTRGERVLLQCAGGCRRCWQAPISQLGGSP
jgi:hypothetical protein